MAKTIDELKSAAAVVRDATEEKENTALRVGQLLVDTIETLSHLMSENIKGYVAIGNTAELPAEPTAEQRMKGYLLGTVLYVYVGTGGDTLDGKYQSADLKGEKGDKGDSGVHMGDVQIADDLATDDAAKVLSARQGKVLKGLIDTIDSKIFYDTSAESYSSEAITKRKAVILEMYVDGEPFGSDNPLEFVSYVAVTGNKKRLYFMRRTANVWAFYIEVPADLSGISIHSKEYDGKTIYFLINWSAPYIPTSSNYHSSVILSDGCYYLERNPNIANFLTRQNVDSQLETLTDNVYYDIPVKYTQEELQSTFMAGGYMDSKIRQVSTSGYGLYLIPIQQGEKIRVKIPHLDTLNAYNGIGFSSSNAVGSSITVLSGKTIKDNIDVFYEATQDGYVCVFVKPVSNANTYEIYHYESILIKDYLQRPIEESQLSESLREKINTDNSYIDKPVKYTQEELDSVFMAGGYMDSAIRQVSTSGYGLYLIPIQQGEKIRVKIPHLDTLNAYNGVGFSTSNAVGSSITVLSGKTVKDNIDVFYEATQNGYICVWLKPVSAAATYEIYHYESVLIKDYVQQPIEETQLSESLRNKIDGNDELKLLYPKFSKKIICSGSSITWGEGKLDNSMVLHVDNFIKNRLSTTILSSDMTFSGVYTEVNHAMMYNGYGRKISTLNDTIEFDSYGDEIAICQMKRRTKTEFGIIAVYADDVMIGIFDNKNFIVTKTETFSGSNIREIRLKHPCTFNHQISINGSSSPLTNIVYNTAGYGGTAPSDPSSFEAFVFRAVDDEGMPVHKIQFSTALGTITSVNITYDYGHIIAHERNTRGQTSDEYTNESYYGSGSVGYDPDHPTGGISSGIEFRGINREAFFVHKFTESKLRHFRLELIGGNNPYFIINFATNRYHDLMNAGIGGWTINNLINDDKICDYTQLYKWFKPEIIFQESETNDDWSYGTRRIRRNIGEISLSELMELHWLEVYSVAYNSATEKYNVDMCTGIIDSISYTSLVSEDIVNTETQVGDIIRIGNYHGDIKQIACRKITEVNLTTGEVKWKEPLSVDEILNIDSLEDLVGAEINIRDLSGYKAKYKEYIEKVHEISPETTVVVVDNGLPMLGVRQLWGYDVIHREIVNESTNTVLCDARDVLYKGQFDSISGLATRKQTFRGDGSSSYDLSFAGAYKSWCGFKVFVNGIDVYGKDCYIESQYAYRAKSNLSGAALNKSTPYYRSNATDNPGSRNMKLVFTKNVPTSNDFVEVWYSDQIWSSDFCHPSAFGSFLYGQAYSKFIE